MMFINVRKKKKKKTQRAHASQFYKRCLFHNYQFMVSKNISIDIYIYLHNVHYMTDFVESA